LQQAHHQFFRLALNRREIAMWRFAFMDHGVRLETCRGVLKRLAGAVEPAHRERDHGRCQALLLEDFERLAPAHPFVTRI
jgi:hypothetical protein